MLRRDAGKSVSICDGFRKHYFLPPGEGISPPLGRDVPRGATTGSRPGKSSGDGGSEIFGNHGTSEWEREWGPIPSCWMHGPRIW